MLFSHCKPQHGLLSYILLLLLLLPWATHGFPIVVLVKRYYNDWGTTTASTTRSSARSMRIIVLPQRSHHGALRSTSVLAAAPNGEVVVVATPVLNVNSGEASTMAAAITRDSSDDDDDVVSQHSYFTTPPTPVYIEDTDAYGVMYNANYLRAYDRALHSAWSSSRSGGSLFQRWRRLPTNNNHAWSIVSVDTMRYKASPALGGQYVITGTLVQPQPDTADAGTITTETWDLVMQSVDGKTVYNTATGVQIALPHDDCPTNNSNNNDRRPWLPHAEPLTLPTSSTTTTVVLASSSPDRFPTYRDEWDAHLVSHLPVHTVLKLWERARSNLLGGPDALRRLQCDHGILTVVTGVRNVQLIDYNAAYDAAVAVRPVPGQSVVTVDTATVLKRRGTVIECYHTASLLSHSGKNSVRMAQGVVTLLAIDAVTKRPVTKLPVWVMETILLGSNKQ
jgi:hypothetical protein